MSRETSLMIDGIGRSDNTATITGCLACPRALDDWLGDVRLLKCWRVVKMVRPSSAHLAVFTGRIESTLLEHFSALQIVTLQ
jgi:hypothetical protein